MKFFREKVYASLYRSLYAGLCASLLLAAPVSLNAATIATVGPITITEDDLKEQLNALTPAQIRAHGLDTLKEIIVQQLVNDAVVLKAAKDAGVEDKLVYKKTMNREGGTLARSLYVQDVVGKAMTKANIKAVYDEKYGGKPQQEVKARHILVKTKEKAEDIITQLDKGSVFAELAQEHSTGPSGSSGGDLGWFTKDTMVPAFAEAAFTLKLGTYTKAPVQTQFGWHIILVEDSRETAPPALKDVRQEIQKLHAERVIQELMTTLREETPININRDVVKSIEYERDPTLKDMPSIDDLITEEPTK